MELAAGTPITYYGEPSGAVLEAGRLVSIGSTWYVSRNLTQGEIDAVQAAAAAALYSYESGPEVGVFQAQDGKLRLETSVQGPLELDWIELGLPALKRFVHSAQRTALAEAGVEARPFDNDELAVVLDLEGPSKTQAYDPSYYDPTGESNTDGTVRWGAVFSHGTQKGLENFGEGVGKVAAAVGKIAGTVAGGIGKGLASGLGFWGVVVAVVLLLIVLAAWMFYSGNLQVAA